MRKPFVHTVEANGADGGRLAKCTGKDFNCAKHGAEDGETFHAE